MKQTAVEWLVEKLKSQGLLIGEPDNLVAVNQAKAMEKEQSESICVNVIERILDKLENGEEINSKEIFEQYYTETYKSK